MTPERLFEYGLVVIMLCVIGYVVWKIVRFFVELGG